VVKSAAKKNGWRNHSIWTLFLLALVSIASGARALAQGAPASSPSDGSPPITQPARHARSETENPEFALARHLSELGRYDEAVSQLLELQGKNPAMPGLARELGIAYYKKSDYLNAASSLSKAQAENPGDQEATQLLGLSYYLAGRPAQAIPLLEKVQSSLLRPDVTGSYLLGIDYLQSFQDDKARAAFARMFSVPPDSAQAHVVLAQMMIREQFEEKAIHELQEGLVIDPRVPMAHFLLGEMYLFKSQVEPAIVEFKKELAENPILWLAYWRMGDAYTRLEQWDLAETALKQSVWLNPDFTGPYILLGKVELKKGDASLAAGFLEHALKMDPNNSSAHYILGEAYQKLGRKADADREFALTQSLRESEKK